MKEEKRVFENRFNNLESKEYLKFQKSWVIFENYESLYKDNIRFFTKAKEDYLPDISVYPGVHL